MTEKTYTVTEKQLNDVKFLLNALNKTANANAQWASYAKAQADAIESVFTDLLNIEL